MEVDFSFFPKQVAFKKFAAAKWAPEPIVIKWSHNPPPQKNGRKDMGLPGVFFFHKVEVISPGISTDFFGGPPLLLLEKKVPSPGKFRKVLALTGSARSWKIRRGAHLFGGKHVVSGLLTGPLRKSMIEAKQHIAAYSISTHMMYKNNYKYTVPNMYIYIYIICSSRWFCKAANMDRLIPKYPF